MTASCATVGSRRPHTPTWLPFEHRLQACFKFSNSRKSLTLLSSLMVTATATAAFCASFPGDFQGVEEVELSSFIFNHLDFSILDGLLQGRFTAQLGNHHRLRHPFIAFSFTNTLL